MNGYGHDDLGRDTIDKVFAKVLGADKAAVRMQFVSGTHAIAASLFGVLRPGDNLLSVTGRPYESLEEVIGLRGHGQGSLIEFGINYEEAQEYYDGFLINARYTHSFTSKLSLRAKVQYSDFSNTWFIEPLLTYQPNAFSALYFGINDLLNTEDDMFSNLTESERQLFVKFQYLF